MRSPARFTLQRFTRPVPAMALAGLVIAASATVSSAQSLSGGESRQLGAHVHGEARLSVALDASGLAYAELSSPAWNLYGFEGAPQTAEQRDHAAQINARLSRSDLIAWPARADCALMQAKIEGGVEGGEVRADAAPPETGHDDHDDRGHDHGDHSHDHHDEAGAGHNDVIVSWSYQCERIQSVGRFDAAALFQALPRLETLDAEAFDGRRAAVRTLSPEDAVITLD